MEKSTKDSSESKQRDPSDFESRAEMLAIETAMNCSGKYDLTIEAIWSALYYAKENPDCSIMEAVEAGVSEWVK